MKTQCNDTKSLLIELKKELEKGILKKVNKDKKRELSQKRMAQLHKYTDTGKKKWMPAPVSILKGKSAKWK